MALEWLINNTTIRRVLGGRFAQYSLLLTLAGTGAACLEDREASTDAGTPIVDVGSDFEETGFDREDTGMIYDAGTAFFDAASGDTGAARPDVNSGDHDVNGPVCVDEDGDGFYLTEGCGTPIDCNDKDDQIFPGALESCDGSDNDCNNLVDDNLLLPSRECSVGVGECVGSGFEHKTCNGAEGWSAEYSGCDAVIGQPAEEFCDGKDNDCDGDIDEDHNVGELCSTGVGECHTFGSWICSDDGLAIVCDAVAGEPTEEICDGLDNDCDELVDEETCDRIVFQSGLDIYVIDWQGIEEPILLTEGGSQNQYPTWSPDKTKIAFVSGRGEIWDIYIMDANGEDPERVTVGLEPSWSPDGEDLVYRTYGGSEICIINIETRERNCPINPPEGVWSPSWSPNGEKIAYTIETDYQEIGIYNFEDGSQNPITDYRATTGEPGWHPDSNQLVFSSDREGSKKIYRMNLDNLNAERVSDRDSSEMHPALSPDGSKVAFYESGIRGYRIAVMDINGENYRVVVDTAEDDITPDW